MKSFSIVVLLLLAVATAHAETRGVTTTKPAHPLPHWMPPGGAYVTPVYGPNGIVTDPVAIEVQSRLNAGTIGTVARYNITRHTRDEVLASCHALAWFNPYSDQWVCYGRHRHQKDASTTTAPVITSNPPVNPPSDPPAEDPDGDEDDTPPPVPPHHPSCHFVFKPHKGWVLICA